jgi:lysophospholipase L1-like esterase
MSLKLKKKLIFLIFLMIPLVFIGLLELIFQIAGCPDSPKVLNQIDHLHAPGRNMITPMSDKNKNSMFIADHELFWITKPNYHGTFRGEEYSLNSYGFRTNEIPKGKNPNTFRIISMGDSATYGLGVLREQSYPFVLEKILRADLKSNNVEVYSAGVMGYTTFQGLRLLKRTIITLKPDLITVAFGANDKLTSPKGNDENFAHSKDSWLIDVDYFLIKSKIYLLLRETLLKKRLYYNPGTVDFRVPIEQYNNNIREIIDIASAHNIKVVLICIPWSEWNKNRDFLDLKAPYRKSLREIAYSLKVPLLDFSDLIDKKLLEQPGGFKKYYLDESHPTESGHLLIAQGLSRIITPIIYSYEQDIKN